MNADLAVEYSDALDGSVRAGNCAAHPGRAPSFEGLTGAPRRESGDSADPECHDQITLGLLTCREGHFRKYVGDGSQQSQPGLFTCREAVESGLPYFGSTHPWIWAIDIDEDLSDEGPASAFAKLLYLLDESGLDEHLTVSSGGDGRIHLFVYEPDCEEFSEGGVRERVMKSFEAAGLGVHFDFRRSTGGCAIRPPLAPHKSGIGRSVPDDGIDDARAALSSWAAQHDYVADAETDRSPRGDLSDLSLRDQALLRGDWSTADRLGPPTPKHANGHVDRSHVDLTLALGFQHVGVPEEQYLQTRRPGGTHPSPKAVEKSDPLRYLKGQWLDAKKRGQSGGAEGIGLLDAFESEVVRENRLQRPERELKVLAALVVEARRISRTSFNFSRRDLSEATGGMGNGPIKRALDGLAEAGLIREEQRTGMQAHLLTLRIVNHANATVSVHRQSPPWSVYVPNLRGPGVPGPDHPVWDREAYGSTGHRTMLCFSATEPRTQAEAMRQGGPKSEQTFRKRRIQLVEAGVLVEVGAGVRDRYVADPEFDWDGHAEREGFARTIGDRRDRLAYQHHEERKEWISYGLHRGTITASEAMSAFERLETTARTRANGVTAKRTQPTSVVGHRIDLATGEIEKPSGLASTTPALTQRHCRCCGIPTPETEPDTGLPWHAHCLMPRYIVRIAELAGHIIPAHLIRPAPLPDWGEFGESPPVVRDAAGVSTGRLAA